MTRSVYTDHAAQKALDAEIKECEERLRTLLKRRNSYAAISHLPNEIMAHIFTACHARSRTPHKASRLLLCISAVCSHWRHIALGATHLWSMISLNAAPDLTIALIRRSKNAPLAVTCPPGAYRNTQQINVLLNMLASETQRFEELTLHANGADISTLVSRLLPVNGDPRAPLLRSLVLESATRGSYTSEHRSPHMLTRFWTDLRSLETLQLRHTLPMEVAIPHMPILTELEINTARIRHLHEHRLSSSWVLSILRQTPLIEDVEITTISSSDPTTITGITSNPTHQIDLPRLSSLSLTFASIQASELVKSITFPSTTIVSLMYENDINDPGLHVQLGSSNATLSQPLRTLKHFISRHSNIDTYTHTDTDTDAHTSTAPECINVYIAIHKVGRNSDSSFEMEITVPTSSSTRLRLSLYILLERFPSLTRKHANLVGSLPLDRIRDLTLRIYETRAEEDVAAWCGMLRYLVNLKSLIVDRVSVLRGLAPSANGSTSTLPSSSSSSSNSNITSTSTYLPIPDLKTLTIHQDPTATPNDWESFIQTCRLRSLHGAPMLEISLHLRDNDEVDEGDGWKRVRFGGVDVDVVSLLRYAKVKFERE